MRVAVPGALSLLTSGGTVRTAIDRRNWQQHHLIPRALYHRPQLAAFLQQVAYPQPTFIDQGNNRLWLPSDEVVAARAGMCMHRGPHPHYTAIVADRVERIRRTAVSRTAAVNRLSRLQRALASVLTGAHGPLLLLNRNDPMRLFADYSPLDDAINALFD